MAYDSTCSRAAMHRLICLGLGLLATVRLAGAAETAREDLLEERRIDGRYLVQAHWTGRELNRFVFPEFPVEIELPGSDGRNYRLRQPFELYTETRRYFEDARIDDAYGDAYAALVANGDCLPVYASFREGGFDCGERGGFRTVAVRTDELGPHLSLEMTAAALIPDMAEFERARSALDELTLEVVRKVLELEASGGE